MQFQFEITNVKVFFMSLFIRGSSREDSVCPLLSGIAQAQGVEVLELEGDVEGVDVDDLRFSRAARSNSTANCTKVDTTY
jgi:hypothetical protein